MKHFRFYNKKDILSISQVRRFETRIGERIHCLNPDAGWPESLKETKAKYILIGIPEDLGVKGNNGMGGAETAWLPFLNAFLNTQSNDYFSGEEILLLGHFDFGDLKFLIESNAYNQQEKLDAYRHAVQTVDEEVENIVKHVASAGKIPIVIGGGSNNAYPLLKAVSKGLLKINQLQLAQLNAIHLGAHTGFGASEGRHSGNAFRYASEDGYLGKLALIGYHENHVSQSSLFELGENPFVQKHSFETIAIHQRYDLIQAFAQSAEFTSDTYCGIELSLDGVQDVLSSFCAPTGITVTQARQFMHFTSAQTKAAYLHIAEGACQTNDGRKDETTGKLISYLVMDFVKGGGNP